MISINISSDRGVSAAYRSEYKACTERTQFCSIRFVDPGRAIDLAIDLARSRELDRHASENFLYYE
jgi:hypothetical protein